LQSAHTQFPAIWINSECANVRPHWEHANVDWTGASWFITYSPWGEKSRGQA
jgi:hypothetical protein